MSTEENKAVVVRWLEEGDNQRNFDLVYELFSPDVVAQHPTSPDPMRGQEVIKQTALALSQTFENYRCDIADVIAEGDRVAVRWTVHGKHVAPFMGVEPTNKDIRISGISIYRVENKRITEAWYVADVLGFMQQVGAFKL